uniref:LamG-like jellyroll fold domain-containing protein n=1 Tax=Auxenochlorella protothecoides TaxID=3075 RepID=A0A1D1ZX47_AUXPR
MARGAMLVVLLVCMAAPVCLARLSTRVLLQAASPAGNAFPAANAFFTLQDGDLASSVPLNAYRGSGTNVSWVTDPSFGTRVLQCDASLGSHVSIPGLSYGQAGPWALGVWARWNVTNGTASAYVLSQNKTTNVEASLDPNTVGLYLPELGNPSYGLVRAVVQDSTATHGNTSVPLFLDSNGCIADILCTNQKNFTLIEDTQDWHLLGLTTLPDGRRGFQLYIDGQLSAELPPGLYTDYKGGMHNASGGAPMDLTGDLVLCSRSDLDAERFFTGQLTQLMVWNQSLTAADWASLYSAGATYLAAPPASPATASPATTVAAAPGPPAAVSPPLTAAVAVVQGQPVCTPNGSVAGLSSLTACYAGYVCAPLPRAQLERFLPVYARLPEGRIGVCAYAPDGYRLPDPAAAPLPAVFYPLNSQTLQSFPLPLYAGVNSGAGVVTDPVFGAALRCDGQQADLVGLATPNYTTNGSLSVNVWMQVTNLTGGEFSYIFSQMGAVNNLSNSGWGPNQIQIYFPQRQHPAYGVVRAYARDSNDTYDGPQDQTWLDSDGYVSNNSARAAPSAALDGGWHMLTVTTMPPGRKGFRLYLDGLLVNEIRAGQTAVSSLGDVVGATAGLPMDLYPNAVLCTRADDPTSRQFDGRLANLGLYDVALTEDQVDALYLAVLPALRAADAAGAAAAPATESTIISLPGAGTNATSSQSQTTVKGNVCVFPALYQGNVVTECVQIAGVAYCQVEGRQWEECAGGSVSSPPAAASPAASADSAGVQRMTQAGERCQFPATFQGSLVTDCVSLNGVPVCQTSSGVWDTCAPLSPSTSPSPASASNTTAALKPRAVLSASGQACQLPLNYRGIAIDNCVSMGGGSWCWTEGVQGWASCANTTFVPPSGAVGSVNASVVPVPIIPIQNRWSTDGDMCILPTVQDGDLLDDCVQRNGTWSCLTNSGAWKACALSGDDQPMEEQGLLHVASRNTVGGDACLLPAVLNGYIFFDCVQYATEGSNVEICPIANSSWATCDPLSRAAPTVFDASVTLARTARGRVNQLCHVDPADNANENQGCLEDLVCVPLPQLNTTALDGLGYCHDSPQGGTFDLPAILRGEDMAPLAFYPLTGGGLETLTLPLYNGSSAGPVQLRWANDTNFGSVPDCMRADSDSITLSNVPFAATNGSFTINLWMRRPGNANLTGTQYQYLFSQASTPSSLVAQTNSIGIYLPDSEHPASGLVRVMVVDGTGDPTGNSANYLDSDGHVNDNEARNTSSPAQNVNDGNWHMITVSTHPNNSLGYSLYLDGRLAASMYDLMLDSKGLRIRASGGHPITSSDNIHLCARFDEADDRYYDGYLAHLMLFDHAVREEQVAQLYNAYAMSAPPGASPGSSVVTTAGEPSLFPPPAPPVQDTSSGGLSAGEIAGIVIGSLAGAALLAGAVAFALKSRKRRADKFERYAEDPAGLPPPGLPPSLMPAVLPGAYAAGTGGRHMEAEMSSSASSMKYDKEGEGGTPDSQNGGTKAGPTSWMTNPFSKEPDARAPSMTTSASGRSEVDIQAGKRSFGSFRKGPATVIVPPEGAHI